MSYEQAQSLVGTEPTWVLRDLIERLPRDHPHSVAARLLLKRRGVNSRINAA